MGTGNPKTNFVLRLCSKGLCFICLRDTAFVDQGNDSDPPESRLRNITRFLGIDQKKILKNYFTCERSRCEGVKVKLCRECSELMEKFDSLYKSLELTRLRLNDCVRRIHALIDEAERDNGRLEEMKWRLTHAPTAGMLDEMRRKVLEESLRATEAALPRVVLERVVAPVSIPIEDTMGPDSEDTHEPEEEIGAVMNVVPDEEPSDEDDQVSLLEAPKSSTSMKQGRCQLSDSDSIERKAPTLKRKVKGGNGRKTQMKSLTCPHCGVISRNESTLLLHTAKFHIHQYFLEHRLPSVTPEQFQKIVSKALFESMIKREGRKGLCAVCPKQLKCDNGNYVHLRIHLVHRHYEDLMKKLVELQQDPDILNGVPVAEEKTTSSCPSKSMLESPTWKTIHCPNCTAVFESQNFSHHVRKCHQHASIAPSTLRGRHRKSSKNSKRLSLGKPCLHCRAVISSTGRLDFDSHLFRHHLEAYFLPEEEFKEPSLTSSQFKQVLKHLLFEHVDILRGKAKAKLYTERCPHCPRTFNVNFDKNGLIWFKLHLIKKHHEQLTQRLRELQKDPELPQKLEGSKGLFCKCGAYFTAAHMYHLHQKRFCNLTDETGTWEDIKKSSRERSCPHCRAEFVGKSSKMIAGRLNSHLLHHHLETYFLPEEEFKEPSLSSCQFKQVLRHFLFENICRTDGSQKCPHCPRIYQCSNGSIVPSLKMHLIKNHRKELAQRLRKLQNDPDVLDKVKRTEGFSCKCGAYYVTMNGRTAHQKKFCNLLGGTTSQKTTSAETSGNVPDDSTSLGVNDVEGESCLLIPDSASEHGRDPLTLKYEYECKVNDQPEVERRDFKNFEIDVEEFVYVAKVEKEPLLKIRRKRSGPGMESVPEKFSKPDKECFR